jgi:hypothetical protein
MQSGIFSLVKTEEILVCIEQYPFGSLLYSPRYD